MDVQDVLLGTVGGAVVAIFAGPAIQKQRDKAVRKLTAQQAQVIADAMESEYPELSKLKVEAATA